MRRNRSSIRIQGESAVTERSCTLRWQVSQILASALVLATPAMAQEAARSGGLEEVVVTAQRREERLQDAPLAISVLSSEKLELRGITDFSSVAEHTPSISFTPYPSSSNTLIMYLRGQGVADSMQITSDGSVGLYQDGFYISRPQLSTFDLADIDRVEVLRGPQGTLYGRNTTGGAVNLISKRPSGELGVKQALSAGSRDYFRTLTVLDLPEWHGLSSKLTFLYSRKDGLVENLDKSSRDYQEEQQRAGRVALAWDGGGPFTADYFFETGDIDSTPIYYQVPALEASAQNPGGIPGYDASGRPAKRTWEPIDLSLSTGEYQAHGLTLSWQVNDSLTIKSLTGFRSIDTDVYQDYASAFSSVGVPWTTGFRTFDELETDQFTQEFQFLGSFGERVDYLVGLYYFNEDGDHGQRIDIDIPGLPPAFGGPIFIDKDRQVEAESTSEAIFAQVTWTPEVLDDRLELTFGGRYTSDNRKATRTTFNSMQSPGYTGPIGVEPDFNVPPAFDNSIDEDFSKFNPSFTANMRWDDDLSTYLRIATGYKAGGIAESGDVGTFNEAFVFDPEEVLTYELGLKSELVDNTVRVNLALFYSEFDDMQVGFNTNPADLSVTLLQNAGEATISGAELEAMWAPIDSLTLALNASYLDPSIDRMDVVPGTIFDPARNPASPYQLGDNIAHLFTLPYVSESSYTASADWTFLEVGENEFSAHMNYRWQDDFFASAPTGPGVPGRDLYSIPSFETLDARLMWSFGLPRGNTGRVSIWGKNITSDDALQHVIGQGAIVPLATVPFPTPAGYTHAVYSWREGATYGVDLVVEF